MSEDTKNTKSQNVTDNLLETFNKHYDEYLERYGLTPENATKKDVEPAQEPVVEVVEEPAQEIEVVAPFPKFPSSETADEVETEEVPEETPAVEDVPAVEESAADLVEETPVEAEELEAPSAEVAEPEVIETEPEEVLDIEDEPEEVTPEIEDEPFEEPSVEETEPAEELVEVDEYYEEPQTITEEPEFYDPAPTAVVEDEDGDLYYDPEAVPVEEDEDEFFSPSEPSVEEEPPPTTSPTPAQPVSPVVEREIFREVLVVDRDQARDLGYSADKYLDEKEPSTSGSSQNEELPPVSNFPAPSNHEPRVSSTSTSLHDEVRAVAEAKRRAEQRAKEEKPAGGFFGLFRRQKEDTTPTKGNYQEVSRVREEGVTSEFIGGGEENAPISLKTQDGYDPRAERLRLQHVATEKRDVDPALWLEETMLDALKLDASDLHIIIDGETRDLRARIRVDGQMRDFDYVQGVPARVIMGRLKAATELSSGGSFAPEETIYTIELNGEPRKARAVLFRVEDGGEALVMRLPLTGNLKHLDELNFAEYNLEHVYDLLAMPYKLIMIAGPMGSGKTTTAHGALMHVAKPTRTVWTIEDPVERRLPNLVQLEIDEDNGAGFDVLLSKLLRADYNTLFLGEIRDTATASAAVRQAKAGRQVMSTIHADDNIKALMRLIELAGDSPMSVLSAVGGVISQRLVRRLNPDWDGVDPDTKYKGRVPIHEILFVDDEIVEVMMQDRPLSEIKQATKNARGSTFAQDATRLLKAGVTDREEIVSVIGEFEEPEDSDN